MADDQDEMRCGACNREFGERQLNCKITAVESCPFCGTVCRETDRTRTSRYDAIVIGDIAAIDEWLESYAKVTGIKPPRRERSDIKEELWIFGDDSKWQREIAYKDDKTNFVAVRALSTENGDAAFSDPNRLQLWFAAHGLQPCGTRFSGMDGVSHKWGAEQTLSTYTLCAELLGPVLSRLDAAMDDAWKRLSN